MDRMYWMTLWLIGLVALIAIFILIKPITSSLA